jgi:Putative Ig domain
VLAQTLEVKYSEADARPVVQAASQAAAQAGSDQGFVAVKAIAPIAAPKGSTFTFVLAEDTFKHAQSKAEISVSAATSDGQPLPDWLKFVPGERRFVGTAPPNVSQVSVVVTARDERGEQVSTTITLNFNN